MPASSLFVDRPSRRRPLHWPGVRWHCPRGLLLCESGHDGLMGVQELHPVRAGHFGRDGSSFRYRESHVCHRGVANASLNYSKPSQTSGAQAEATVASDSAERERCLGRAHARVHHTLAVMRRPTDLTLDLTAPTPTPTGTQARPAVGHPWADCHLASAAADASRTPALPSSSHLPHRQPRYHEIPALGVELEPGCDPESGHSRPAACRA